ncbi:hypothetical protein T03_6639 [Trichinella britovi]|uniref:Uncharacterized protein n=1 Tax=Trichinella britovi TaxID=45882 RepID=A0A0V1DIY9_TRIBR|nr:hypothetical protein T03_6639 [Trichinella britovi]
MKFLRNGACVFDFDKSIITAYCVLVQHNCHYAHFTAVDLAFCKGTILIINGTVIYSYSVDYKIGENVNEARLAQSVEHGTLNPRVVGSSPTSGVFPLMFQFAVLYRMFIYQPTASSVQDK